MTDTVDITGLDKAELLAAFYNASTPLGMGFLQAKPGGMTVEEAGEVIAKVGDDHARNFPSVARSGRELSFDYLYGRPLKIDLSGDEMRTRGFDRDNGGEGAAAAIVERLRGQAQRAAS